MSGKKGTTPLHKLFQATKEKSKASSVASITDTTPIDNQEMGSSAFQSGMEAKTSASIVYSVTEANVQKRREQELVDKMKKEQQEIAQQRQKELAQTQKKEKEAKEALEKAKAESPISQEIVKIKADPKNYERINNPTISVDPTGSLNTSIGDTTKVASGILNAESLTKISALNKIQEEELAPINQQLKTAQDISLQASKKAMQTEDFLKKTQRLEELDQKAGVFGEKYKGQKTSQRWGIIRTLGEQKADDFLENPLGYTKDMVRIVSSLPAVFEYNASNLIQGITSGVNPLSEEEIKEHAALKEEINLVAKPVVQQSLNFYKEQLDKSKEIFAKNDSKKSFADGLSEGMVKAPITNLFAKAEDAHIRAATISMERAIEEVQNYLDGKGGADIFLSELTKISIGEYGLFEDAQMSLSKLKHYDDLVLKEERVGFEGLTAIEQEALTLYNNAEKLENEVAGKQSFGYTTVKGTMSSVGFMRDMWLGARATTGVGSLFGTTRASMGAKTAEAVIRATNSSKLARVAGGGVKSASWLGEAAITTYINPKSINDRKYAGSELYYDGEGKPIDFKAGQALYDSVKIAKDKDRILLTDAKQKLESKPNLSSEEQDMLEMIKARLGEAKVEGIPSLEEELEQYEVDSSLKAHLKGIGDTGIEKASELFVGKGIEAFGDWLKVNRRTGQLYTRLESATNRNLGRFYNTGVGRAYKNWQELVSQVNINDTKLIGSIFEELPEEYAAAAMHSLFDWDSSDLEEIFTTDGARDVASQTLLMNVMFGVAGNTQQQAKLRYNSMYTARLEAMNTRLATLQKFVDENPNDVDGKRGLAEYQAKIKEVSSKSSLGVLDPTRLITRDNTGFSATRQYVNDRRETRKNIDLLRFASSDEDINLAVDVASVSSLGAADKEYQAQVLEAKGKVKEAAHIRKSMFKDILFKSFSTNTDRELEAGLKATLSNEKISPEKRVQLMRMHASIVELRRVKDQYQKTGAKNANQAVAFTYDILSAKAELEDVQRLLSENRTKVQEALDAYLGTNTNITPDNLVNIEEDLALADETTTQAAIDALYQTGDPVIIAQIDGLNLVNKLKHQINKAYVARTEVLHPSMEVINSKQLLKEVSEQARVLLQDKTNPLGLKNVEYDEQGEVIHSKELIAELYDAMKDKWVGKAIDGKVSQATLKKLKDNALDSFDMHLKHKEFMKGLQSLGEATKVEGEADQQIDPPAIEPTTPITDGIVEEAFNEIVSSSPIFDVELPDTDSFIDSIILPVDGAEPPVNIPGEDVPEPDYFPGDENAPPVSTTFDLTPEGPTATSEHIVISDEDFDDFMLAPKHEYSPEDALAITSFVKDIASHIMLFTGQDVTLSMAFDQFFRTTDRKQEAIISIPHFINGWIMNGFVISSNEIMELYQKYSAINERAKTEADYFNRVSQIIPNAFTQPVGNTTTLGLATTLTSNEQVNAQLGGEPQDTSYEENRPTSELGTEDANKGKTLSVKPKVGFSAMAYENVTLSNGMVVRKTISNFLNIINGHPLGLDFRPLLHPDNGPQMTLKVEKVDESLWGDIVVSQGVDSMGMPILNDKGQTKVIPFTTWVELNKSNPNFEEDFQNKVPYVFKHGDTVVGYVHDFDWYNPINVSHPEVKDMKVSEMDEVWHKHIQEGKEATALLRQNIAQGLIEVTANIPTNALYHTLHLSAATRERLKLKGRTSTLSEEQQQDIQDGINDEDEPLITIRESNPQAIMTVQLGVTETLAGLDEGFANGSKKLLNSKTGTDAIGKDTSGHTWAVHRVGTEINPVTGKKVETYRATKVNRVVTPEQYESLQWAIATHKVLNGVAVPQNFGMTPKEAEDRRKQVRATMDLNIANVDDLATYLQHFVKLTGQAITAFNATRTYKAKDVTDKLAYMNVLFEQNLPYGQVLALVQQNTAQRGLTVSNKLSIFSRTGVETYKTPDGKEGNYHDYLMDTVYTNIKTFDMDSTGTKPMHALGVQPVITIDYTPVGKTEAQVQQERVLETAKTAVAATQTQEAAETFDEAAAIKYLDSLGVSLEDFLTEEDLHIGDLSKVSNLFQVTPGLSIAQERPLKEEIAHKILTKLALKKKATKEDKEAIRKQVEAEIQIVLQTYLKALNTLLDKANAESTPSDKVVLIKKAIASTKLNIENIITNFSVIYDKAISEVKVQAKIDLKEDIELQDQEDSTIVEKNHSKDSVEESLKTKASERLRMLFSGIPQHEYQEVITKKIVDGKEVTVKTKELKPVLGYLGFPRYMSLNDVYNEVLKHVSFGIDSESNFKGLVEKLSKDASPAMKEVIKRLKESEEQVQNEFVYNVVAHTLTSKFAMFQEMEDGFSLKIYDTNANEINRVLKNIWIENSVASDLYNFDGTINVEYASALIEEFNSFPTDVEQVSEQQLRDWLSKVGMEVNDKTWSTIFTGELEYQGKSQPFSVLYSQKKGGLFPNILNYLKEAILPVNAESHSASGTTNFLSDLSGISNAIATVEARYNPQLVSLSFRDTGKNINTQVPPKYITDKVAELVSDAKGTKEKILALQSISFSQDSLFLDLLKSSKEVADNFSIHHTSITALKEKGTKAFGNNDITALGELDYDLVTTTGFSDRRVAKIPTTTKVQGYSLRMANMLFPTMSDKSTGLFLTSPVFDFLKDSLDTFQRNEAGEVTGLTEEATDLMFTYLVLPELKRMHNFYKNVKATNVKGYDLGAGMFHLLPIMNTLTDGKGSLLIDVLKRNADAVDLDTFLEMHGNAFKSSIQGVIRKEVDHKTKQWEEARVTVKGKKQSKMFSTEYFTDVAADPEKDYEVAVWDYVMNSMVFNAEAFKVFAGDVAMFSQDKLFKKEIKDSTEYISINKQIGVNLGKRLALLIAPGKKIANSANEQYNQIILKDATDITSNAETLIEMYYDKETALKARPTLQRYDALNAFLQRIKARDISNKSSEAIAKSLAVQKRIEKELSGIRDTLADTYKSLDAYFDIESTDAQEYTTVTEHLNILDRLGRITPTDHKIILDKLFANQELTKEELSLVMQPIKPVHTGTYVDTKADLNRTVYIKSSAFPLIPQLTAGTKLDELRKTLEELEGLTGRFTRASYQSANKVGSVPDANAIDPFDANDLRRVFKDLNTQTGDFTPATTNSVLVLSRNNFRIQQDVPFKSDKRKRDEVAMGTQIFKLLFGDGVKNGATFNFKGNSVSGEELYSEYNSAFTKIVEANKLTLFRELGLSPEGKIIEQEAFIENLQILLEKEAIDRGYSIKSIRGLKMDSLINAATGQVFKDFKIPLWLSPDSNRYESLLNSIITNRIMKHKMPGGGYVVGSESGFAFQEGREGIEESRVIYLDGWNGVELQGVHTMGENADEYHFSKAQVLAPSKFKDANGKLIDLFEGYNPKTRDVSNSKYLKRNENGSLGLKEGMIDTELLNLFSFRTPTSSHVSGSSIEIVGFLPPESGDLMVVPKNFTKQKGLDYDIDKESGYQLNHVYNRKTKRIEVLREEHFAEEIEHFTKILDKFDYENQILELKGNKYQLEGGGTAYAKPSIYDLKNSLLERFTAIFEDTISEQDREIMLDPTTSIKDKIQAKKIQMDKKLAENDFIRVHLAVYNSPDVEIQKKINKILSMQFSGGQAKLIEGLKEEGEKAAFIATYLEKHPNISQKQAEKAYIEDYKNSTILGYSYQKTKMSLGSVGKVAIGVYANYTTYNSLVNQIFGEKGMPIENSKTGEPKVMTIGNFTSSTIGSVSSLAPTTNAEAWHKNKYQRDSSEIWAEKENTATDNEKEQILGRVGVSEDTINVDSITTLRGFDKDENGNSIPYLLLSQPIIKEYLDKSKKSKGVLGTFSLSQDLIAEVVSELSNGEITYELSPETLEYEFVREGGVIYWEGSAALTGNNLLDGIKTNGKDKSIQLDAFMTFIELQNEGKIVSSIQKVTNTNTLGKSMVESAAKQEALAKLPSNKMFPDAIKLLGSVSKTKIPGSYPFSYTAQTKEGPMVITHYITPTTPQGQIVVNGLNIGGTLFKDFFPYQEEAIKTVINEIGVSENENTKIEEIELILEEIKKYFYSNPNLGVFSGDVQEKRKELFVDSETNTSLAKYLMTTLRSTNPAYRKGIKVLAESALLKRFKYEVGKGDDKVSVIKYNNAATDNLDEESLYNSLPEILESNFPLPDKDGKPYSTNDLVQDLVAYSFLEGGIQEATQFVKFIPVELLEAMGRLGNSGNFLSIANNLKAYNPKRNTKQDLFDNFLGIKAENIGGLSTFTKQFFQHNPTKAKKIPFAHRKGYTDKGGLFALDKGEYATAPSYVYVSSGKITRLYMHTGNHVYSEVDILSGKGISQYQYKKEDAKNVKQPSKVPAPTPNLISPPDSAGTLKGTPQTTISAFLEDVTKLTLSPEYAHLTALANWIKDATKGPGIVQVIDKSLMMGAGASNVTGNGNNGVPYIKLSSSLFEEGSSAEKMAEIFIHEVIHQLSVKELSKYYEKDFFTLKEGAPAHVVQLHKVFVAYSETFEANDLKRYRELVEIIRDNTLPMATRQGAMLERDAFKQRTELYAAANIKEFLALTLTERSFQKHLSSLPSDIKDKSLLQRIQDILVDIFKEIFPEIKENTLAMDALKVSMNFIQEENKLSTKSSVSLPEINPDPVMPNELVISQVDPQFPTELGDNSPEPTLPELDAQGNIITGNTSFNFNVEETTEQTIKYTPKGKATQTYTVKGEQIFNAKGVEVFKADSVDRTKLLANLGVKLKTHVVIQYNDKTYVVNKATREIISGTTGKVMQWDETHGNRVAILAQVDAREEDLALAPSTIPDAEWNDLTEEEKLKIKECL